MRFIKKAGKILKKFLGTPDIKITNKIIISPVPEGELIPKGKMRKLK